MQRKIEKMPKVTKTCEQCGEEFIYDTNSHSIGRFCSRKCIYNSSKVQIKKLSGKNINCLNCKKEFYIAPWQIKKNTRFCSSKCYGKEKEFQEKYLLKCDFCEKDFIKIKSKRRIDKTNCCSHKCANRLRVISVKGMTSFKIKYSREILGNTCQRCGSNNTLHTHHIDGNRNNNPMDGSNWIVLCQTCHFWCHKMARTITRYLTREEILGIVPIGQRLKKPKAEQNQLKLF